MNTTTKGIIGAVGAAAIGVGAYFGFSGGEDGGVLALNDKDQQEIEAFEKYILEAKSNNAFKDTNDNAEFDTEASFYTWSWKKFLYLTQLEGKQYKFQKEFREVDDFGEHLSYDHFLEHNQIAIDPATSEILKQKFKDFKPLILFLDAQADGAIISTNGGGNVYYSIHANQSFIDEMDDYADKFVNYQYELEGKNFKVGSTELKASWSKATDLIKKQGVNTQTAIILSRNEAEGEDASPQPYKIVGVQEVALLGLHIATVVNGHPEFVWSTFELDNLAPDKLPNNEVDERDNRIFANAKEEMILAKSGNIYNENGITNSDDSLTRDGNLIEKNAVFSSTPLGVRYNESMEPLKENDKKTKKITEDVNAIVRKHLNLSYLLVGSIWAHVENEDDLLDPNNSLAYFLNEIAVVKKGQTSKTYKGIGVGSMKCFNKTMETSFQSHESDTITKTRNCFTCHGVSKSYKVQDRVYNSFSTLNTSHIFRKKVQLYIQGFKKSSLQQTNSMDAKDKIRKQSIEEMRSL